MAPFDELCNSVPEDEMKKPAYYKRLVQSMEDDRNPDWESLESEFRSLVYLSAIN